MDVLFQDVHLVEQRIVEQAVPALRFLAGRRVILVDGHDLYVAERHFSGLVAPRQFVVERGRRGAGGQSEAEQPAFGCLDGIDDDIGHGIRSGVRIFIEMGPNFLVGMQDAFRQVFLDESAVIRQGKMLAFHILEFLLHKDMFFGEKMLSPIIMNSEA